MALLSFSDSLHDAIDIAKVVAQKAENATYAPAHLLFALLDEKIGLQQFIQEMDKDITYLRDWAEVRIGEYPKKGSFDDITVSYNTPHVFEQADYIRLKWGSEQIDPLCVFAALAIPGVGFNADELRSYPVKEQEIHDLHFKNSEQKQSGCSRSIPTRPDIRPRQPICRVYLEQYCTEKTALARRQAISPIVCRDKESRIMMEILGRYGKPNVLIIGEPGVGKTAMVNGLACNIATGRVPQYLKDVLIYALDAGTLATGIASEERIKGVIKELTECGNAILFIDDIHALLDSNRENSGMVSILKPALIGGKITIIGATTMDGYRKLIEPNHAFNRCFEVLQIAEPDTEATITILESQLHLYTRYHGVSIDKNSLTECVSLAKRYAKEKRLPDSAIDLIDRTMSAIKMMNQNSIDDLKQLTQTFTEIEAQTEISESERIRKMKNLFVSINHKMSPILLGMLKNHKQKRGEPGTLEEWRECISIKLKRLLELTQTKIEKVSSHEVAAVIAYSTGIPIGKIESAEKERLLRMEEILRRRVVGQDGALNVLSDAIIESRSGMNKPGQPIGSFFFLGPTGTGKTELAKALAEVLFNDERAMIRFDMSEFKESYSVSLLHGSPPGYVGYEEGGLLVNKIRQQPYSVVLFDEIEKAHASVYDIFLQIMDEGKLHDKLGKEGDFSNSIVIFTSNVGSEWLAQQIHSGKTPQTNELMEVMGEHFRLEFLTRLSEIVPFAPINESMLVKIFDIQLQNVAVILDKQGISLQISEEAKEILAHRNFSPQYGARQVVGTIRNYIRRPLSKMIIEGKLTSGHLIEITADSNNEIIFKASMRQD
ncbi:MAG: ATP-dependent Clp protease ATP-binding subunit [Bacteroidales bacterium]